MAFAILTAIAVVVVDYSIQLIWFVPVGVIAFCYTLALFPLRGGTIRLRDVPYLKVFLIVGVVTYVTTYLPLLYGESQVDVLSSNFTLIAISRALFLFAITLPFDIRDFDFDIQTKLKTIPGKIGVGKTKVISVLLILAFVIIEFARFILYNGSPSIFVALLISGLVAAGFILKAKPNGSEYFYSLGLEGTMIIQFILVAIAVQMN